MQRLLHYTPSSMKVSPFLSVSWDSLMAPLFTPVRSVYLPHTHIHTLLHPPIHPFRVRKQPPSGLREEKVPYLIISSHSEKHTAQGFYMAAAAGVGFPLAGPGLVRGLIVRVLGLNEVTWWWGTSMRRINDIWASLVGICQDKSHKLWSQAERTDRMCVYVQCVWETKTLGILQTTLSHLFSFFIQPDHLSVGFSVTT